VKNDIGALCHRCGLPGPKPCKSSAYCEALAEIARLRRALRKERAVNRVAMDAIRQYAYEESDCHSTASSAMSKIAAIRRGKRKGRNS
jgi:hypothetical protein